MGTATFLVALLLGCAVYDTHGLTFERVHGLVAPVFTPLYMNGTVNYDAIPAQAAYLNKTGVKYIFTMGTTGESVDFTVQERMMVTRKWLEVVGQYGQKVITHVGADSVMTAKLLTEDAVKHGTWAIAAMSPTYIKPASVEALVDTLKFIAEQAPTHPFYYYHIPSMTDIGPFKMIDMLNAADGKIPTLAGIKFTDYNMMDFLLCVEFKNKKYNMLYGHDEQWLSALILGAEGAVGTTYNMNGDLQNAITKYYQEGDLKTARRAQLAVSTFINTLQHIGDGCSCDEFKLAMDVINEPDVGPARLPYIAWTSEQQATTKSALLQWCKDFSDIGPTYWCKKMLSFP